MQNYSHISLFLTTLNNLTRTLIFRKSQTCHWESYSVSGSPTRDIHIPLCRCCNSFGNLCISKNLVQLSVTFFWHKLSTQHNIPLTRLQNRQPCSWSLKSMIAMANIDDSSMLEHIWLFAVTRVVLLSPSVTCVHSFVPFLPPVQTLDFLPLLLTYLLKKDPIFLLARLCCHSLIL